MLARPTYQERLFFVGTNGSGKTKLMREFYLREPRYCVMDPKGDFPKAPGDKVVKSPKDFRWNLFPDGLWGSGLFAVPRILYRPDPKYQPTMDLRLRWLFYKARKLKKRHRPAFRVGVDEGLFQSKAFSNSRPRWLMSSAITGRSLDLGLDLNSQRPSGIPVEIRSEAWRMYVFYLGDQDDMKAILRYAQGTLTIDDLMDLGEDFSFIEVKRTPGGRRQATRFPPIRLSHLAQE